MSAPPTHVPDTSGPPPYDDTTFDSQIHLQGDAPARVRSPQERFQSLEASHRDLKAQFSELAPQFRDLKAQLNESAPHFRRLDRLIDIVRGPVCTKIVTLEQSWPGRLDDLVAQIKGFFQGLDIFRDRELQTIRSDLQTVRGGLEVIRRDLEAVRADFNCHIKNLHQNVELHGSSRPSGSIQSVANAPREPVSTHSPAKSTINVSLLEFDETIHLVDILVDNKVVSTNFLPLRVLAKLYNDIRAMRDTVNKLQDWSNPHQRDEPGFAKCLTRQAMGPSLVARKYVVDTGSACDFCRGLRGHYVLNPLKKPALCIQFRKNMAKPVLMPLPEESRKGLQPIDLGYWLEKPYLVDN